MNIEELKLILEAIQGISGMGADVAYGYLAINVVDKFLSVGVGITFIVLFYKLVRFGFRCFFASEKLRLAAGVHYEFNDQELDKACRVLKKYYKNEE